MSTHIFTWAEDRHGETGWLLKGMEDIFDAVGGRSVAHDVFEHLPRGRKHGVIADEMMALGVRLHLRVLSQWWWTKSYLTTPAQAWASEIAQQLEYIQIEGYDVPAPRSVPEVDDETERIIAEALQPACAMYREMGFNAIEPYDRLLQRLVDWLRVGVAAGAKRWPDPANAMGVLEYIERQVDHLSQGRYEGDRLIVKVHEASMRADCHVKSAYY